MSMPAEVVHETDEVLTVTGAAFSVNYGLNRVRFPAPLPVGARVRMRAMVAAVEELAVGHDAA
jgi:acyl dehydratase